MASPLTDIPDHLLAEIFLRLPTPQDLARASAACAPFRRLATDASFLRAFRRLHAPLHLGVLHDKGFHLAHPAQPSAPAARALAPQADFSFSFLPSHHHWIQQDVRGSRVLLSRAITGYYDNPVFQEFAVCDPLRRQYVLLPQLPDDLAASVEHPVLQPFLAPLSEQDAAAAEETSFRVICLVRCRTKLAALVFSSSIGQWQAGASKGWSDLVLDTDSDVMSRLHPLYLRRHYAYGCFYWDWLVVERNLLLVLDTNKMEFSIASLPPGEWRTKGVAIVEAGEGRLGMFALHGENEFASHLSYTSLPNRGETPSQWQMEKTISLDRGYRYYIKAATEGCLLLMRTESLPYLFSIEEAVLDYFSMDIKTLQLQRVCGKVRLSASRIYPHFLQTGIYTNFPPSLLPPRTV